MELEVGIRTNAKEGAMSIGTTLMVKYGDKTFRPARQRQPHYHHTFITYSTTTA